MQKVKKGGCLVGLLLVGFLLVCGGLLAAEIMILPEETAVTSTLTQLYADDQAVRMAGIETPLDIVRFSGGDWIRVNKVRRIVDADLLSSADDYAYAARILQHGERPLDFQLAQELSIKAYELGDETMLRHAALAEDRYLVETGEPQKYGSQFRCAPDVGWELYPVDESVTDEQRAEVDIEPLAEMEAKMGQLNDLTNNQCNLRGETMQQIETIMEGAPE